MKPTLTQHWVESSRSFPLHGATRSKIDWAGIGIGDAFRSNHDYRVRLAGQRLFYETLRKAERAMEQEFGTHVQSSDAPPIQPQLGPCYTTYPATMASYAAIGLTVFLKFRELTDCNLLSHYLKGYLRYPIPADVPHLNTELYRELVQHVAKSVQTRLLLADLSRSKSLAAVEAYRLFAAAHRNHLRFSTVARIVDTVVLYGDLVPDWRMSHLHPLTSRLIKVVSEVSRPFSHLVSSTSSDRLLELGANWVSAICEQLASTLNSVNEQRPAGMSTDLPTINGQAAAGIPSRAHSPSIPALDAPLPPGLFHPQDFAHQIELNRGAFLSEEELDLIALRRQLGEDTEDVTRIRALAEFANAIARAGGQSEQWEDMRSDLVGVLIAVSAFETGPIEGGLVDGHEVSVCLRGTSCVGEQFDRPVELSEDLDACKRLLQRCQRTIDTISRVLYPNVEYVPVTERVCTSGSLDPGKLAVGDVSSAIYKRNHITAKADLRGKALLVIACDGSGSLNTCQMQMLKTLTCSWLMATVHSNVEVLAGLYHSGAVRPGVTAPLVQWIAHPKKTPALGNRDAVRALVTLPDTGTGVQSDALSLSFIMDEARSLTKGTIYLIHITDCKWNRSFDTSMTGEEEVRALFESWEQDSCQLHITMVALGGPDRTGLETLVDNTIALTDGELQDFTAVADKIGRYVALCISERNRLPAS